MLGYLPESVSLYGDLTAVENLRFFGKLSRVEMNIAWEVLGLKWINLIGLLIPSGILWLLAYIGFLRRENIYGSN